MSQGREQFVVATFIELADTLASGYEVGEFLHLLVERCQEALDVDAGGVLLEGADGTLQLVAATSEKMERLEQAEMDNKEGPCIDAYRDAQQVTAGDLNDERGRWPNVAHDALEMGLRAVFAFPLRLRTQCIGALNLYREQPGDFGEDDIRLAQAFADVAAIGILHERHAAEKERTVRQLQQALDSRVVIEQAKGILIERYGIAPEAAFGALRQQARNSRTNIHGLARQLVDERVATDSGPDGARRA